MHIPSAVKRRRSETLRTSRCSQPPALGYLSQRRPRPPAAPQHLPPPTSPPSALGLVAQLADVAGAHAGHTKKRKTRRSPCLSSGGAGNRTQVREASSSSSFTCVAAVTPAAGLVDSATTYPPLISVTLSGAPLRYPALVVDAFGVLGRPSPRTALRFLTPREQARCRSHVSRPA